MAKDQERTPAGERPVEPSYVDNRLRASNSGYRWTCPYCGDSRLNTSADESGERNAIAALRTHILATEGDGHGPEYELPDDSLTLSEHVIGVDGRE